MKRDDPNTHAARVEGIAVPNRLGWIGATTVGYALGMALSTFLVGAVGRPFSPILGGILFVLLFGAIIGIFLGLSQFLVIPRGAVPLGVWTLATLLGAAVGFAAAAWVGEIVGNLISPTTNAVVGEALIEGASGAIVGLAIGWSQWLVLRRRLPNKRGWLVASLVGGALGYAIALGVLDLLEVPLLKTNLIPSYGAILGIFVGSLQSLALRTGWRR